MSASPLSERAIQDPKRFRKKSPDFLKRILQPRPYEVAGITGLNTNLTNWCCASLICVLGLTAVGLGLCYLKFFRG